MQLVGLQAGGDRVRSSSTAPWRVQTQLAGHMIMFWASSRCWGTQAELQAVRARTIASSMPFRTTT